MLKAILTSIVVPGMALLLAMPTMTFAEPRSRTGSHIRGPSASQSRHHRRHYRHHQDDRRHTRDVRRYRYESHPYKRHHRHHHGHKRHNDIHIGVNIGGYGYYPRYPHGHIHHIHNSYCPVVISPVIIAPVWEVYYHSYYRPSAVAMLNVIIGPFSGSLYIDDQYYGEAHSLHNGRLELPVSPGLHTVQLHSGGRTYSQKVHAKPGAIAVVKANKM